MGDVPTRLTRPFCGAGGALSAPDSPGWGSRSREFGRDKWGKRVAPWEAAVRDLTQVPSLRRSKDIAAIRARPARAARAADSGGCAPKRGETMKRYAGAFTLLTVLGGCVTSDKMNPGP